MSTDGSTAEPERNPLDQIDGKTVRIPKAAEVVADRLRSQIVRGELLPGDALPPEQQLAGHFGISRPSLREALRILESESLIRVQRGVRGGPRVQAPDGEVAARATGLVLQHRGTTIRDIFEARAILEAPCAGIVAKNRTTAELERLEQAVAREEQALDNPVQATPLQVEFHLLVVQLTGNQTLGTFCSMLHHIIDAATISRVSLNADDEDPARGTRLGTKAHRKLVGFIAAGDATSAEEFWRLHIREITDYILADLPTQTVVDLLS